MGDDEDGRLDLVPELGDQALHLVAGGLVEGREGLVHEDDLRFEHQGAGDGHALLLTAGKLVGVFVLVAVETDPADPLHGQVVHGRAVEAELGRAISRPKVTLRSTVRLGKELYFWKTMPRSRPGPVTSSPRTRTSPVVGG